METQEKHTYSTDHINQEVIDILGYLEQDAYNSKHCLENNVLTKTASNVKEFFVNPMGAFYKNYSTFKDELFGFVKTLMVKFFKIHNDILYKVVNEPNSLRYIVALHNDTIKNRRIVYNFLEFYESVEFAKDFPVYIQFVPTSVADSLASQNIIQLADGETYSAS